MQGISVKFHGVSKDEPKQMDLPAVPRVGDHMTLDSGILYRVTHVHWSFTTKDFSNIVLHVEPEKDAKTLNLFHGKV